MKEIFTNLTPGQATLISSIISALIAISVILIKKQFERKKQIREKYDTIKKYANPIICASEQLAWRIKEILEFNGTYLRPNAPMNGFFKYKFDSTVYRLCALLGWIQAAKKEQSYLEGLRLQHHKNIQDSIALFQKGLADGSHVEVSILNDLTDLFKMDTLKVSDNERALIGVELEKIVFDYIPDNIKRNVGLLDETKQVEMIKNILDYISTSTKQRKIKVEVIHENRVKAINEISREFCWIYRDWQSAIGDVMLKRIEGANRNFDVIGFGEFMSIRNDNEWVKKVDGLFSNIDVSIEDRFDTRVKQLKDIFNALIQLISVLKDLLSSQETIPNDSFQDLEKFNEEINKRPIKKKKRKLKIVFE